MPDDNLTIIALQAEINELKNKVEKQEEEIKELKKKLRIHINDVDYAHRI